MKRRAFIYITVGAAAAVSILPVVRYKKRKFTPHDPLLEPEALARFCDENEICAIGKHYRSLVPGENKKAKLIELLLTNEAGGKEKSTDKSVISTFIEEKIKADFKADRTIIARGWVISETEARQCALVSFVIN